MSEYLFMYFLAFVAVLFAVVQDLRTREISNWVTFSLIAFVLAYRAFYSVYSGDLMFFVYGLIGIVLFTGLGYLFYYSKVFAGGDAKLLFGIGGIFPYYSFYDYIYYGFGFVLLLFAFGVIYTLIYSLFLVGRNYSSFRKSFFEQVSKVKFYFILSLLFAFFFYLFFPFVSYLNSLLFAVFVFLIPLLFAYVKAVEKSCMIKLVSPLELTEGDWLERDVVVSGKTIRKSFAGLSFEQILLLRRYGKKVLVKNGIPFAPSFLLALLFFLFYVVAF
ncbi:MAG: A24 family peptidase [Nanoarchaeota archaeon]